jgi:predicted RNA-binding protein with PIN domain
MPLHFILDGYNIIKSEHSGAFSGLTLQAQRERLVTLIKKNTPQGKPENRITVVFDGTYVNSFLGDRSVDGAVEVIFSSGDTADRLIETVVNGHPDPGNVVAVTDDTGIRRMIAGTGAKIMKTKEFSDRLFNRHIKTAEPSKDESRSNSDEITSEFSKRWLK